MSHPSWVCGLKLPFFVQCYMLPDVTPFVGVWIETTFITTLISRAARHTLRGCVD